MFPFSSIHAASARPSDSEISVLFFNEDYSCISDLSHLATDPTALTQQARLLGLSDKNSALLISAPDGNGYFILAMAPKQRTAHSCRQLGAAIYHILKPTTFSSIAIIWPDLSNDKTLQQEDCVRICQGLYGASYQFTEHLSDKPVTVDRELTHVLQQRTSLMDEFDHAHAVVLGQQLTKDLMHEPPNVLTPDVFAKRIQALSSHGLQVEVMDEAQLKAENMHALLSVGQGSSQPSRLVTVRWCGQSSDCADPIALVGKGVCFDSGGINIKLSQLVDMKYDMGGAASIIGAMQTIARLKVPTNVIAVIALVENMPGGNAYRPSDIIGSRSGKTIEVLNTDAEGRLILADAIDYACDFKPRAIVDLATLTGAVVVGLGHEYAGFFSNNDTLAKNIESAAVSGGEKLWQLPLDPAYDRLMDSTIADVSNLSAPGGGAGSITAAQFLQRFTRDVAWAHIDIAGTAWISAHNGVHAKGPTGYGVETLVELVKQYQGA